MNESRMTIEQRFASLERGVRLWRGVTVCLALALVAGVTVAATESDVADVLKCRELVVVGEQGETRLELGVDWEDWPRLALVDKKGRPRLVLAIGPFGPRLYLVDEAWQNRLILSADGAESGNPKLTLMNERGGKVRVQLTGSNSEDTGGTLVIKNKTDEEVVQLYADEYGNGVVGAWNRKGKGRTLEPGP